MPCPPRSRAGQATTSYAPAEAQRHLERALEIWPRVADAEERTGLDQAEVTRLAADAAYRPGAVDRSVSLYDQALADLPAGDDPFRRALVIERRAVALRDSGRETEAIAELERALALLPPGQVTRAHAVVLASLACALLRTSDRDVAAGELAERAVAAARATGATEEEADASISLGLAHCYLRTADEDLQAIRSGLALALAANVPATALRGYVNLSDVLELRGRHAEAAEVAREGLKLADRVGMVRALGAYLIGNLAEPLLRLGRWEEVDALLAQALSSVPEGIFAATVLQLRAERAAMSGRYADAEADLRTARAALGGTTDVQFVLPLGYVTAIVALGREDLPAAQAAVAGSLPAEAFVWAARYTWPLLWLGMRIEADEAVRARDRREPLPEESAARHRVLAALAAGLPAATPTARGYQALSRPSRAGFLGQCTTCAALGRPQVASGEAAQGTVPPGLHLAAPRPTRSPRPAGTRPAATRPCGRLTSVAGRIGADPITARRRPSPAGPGWTWRAARAGQPRTVTPGRPAPGARRARSQGTRSPGNTRPGSQRTTRPVRPDRTGTRSPAAAGRTATRDPRSRRPVHQGPKTASVPLSNILAKLGVGGRVEAAAVVHRLGVTR